MKAILISDILEEKQALKPLLKKHNLDLIHYRSPLKAMDNISEIDPDIIIINTIDFPRHWKVLAQYIRWDTPKEEILLLLLVNEQFSQQDADKATHLSVQGIIKIKNNFNEILPEIKNILQRYNYAEIKNDKKDISKIANCMFINPENGIIITGLVKDISLKSIKFIPDVPSNIINLDENTIIERCTIQLNLLNIETQCRLIEKKSVIELEFLNIPSNLKKEIQAISNN